MPWRVTVRNGPRVERLKADSLDAALDLLEERARALAAGPRRKPVSLRVRTFDPIEQVAGRAEIKGPGRLLPAVRGGVDVRGDGSVEAFVGGARREVVAVQPGETPYAALRRVLAERA